MPSISKTSASHPIRVDWLATPWMGKVGLTFAPGKKQPNAATGSWDRDLSADLARLRSEFGADHLVCLLQDHEFEELAIGGLAAASANAGIAFHRLPIADGSEPANPGELADVSCGLLAENLRQRSLT